MKNNKKQNILLKEKHKFNNWYEQQCMFSVFYIVNYIFRNPSKPETCVGYHFYKKR